jgi:cell wall-associated NlpC family hydrolase
MAQTGISGKALGLATAGGVLVYAGLRGESPLEALRGILTGSPAPIPQGRTVTLDVPESGSAGATGTATGAPGSVGRAVSIALQQVGKPYKWGSIGPNSFDCSGLIVYSFRKAGMNVPRWTSATLAISTQWRKISRAEVRAGDVAWKVGHVALITGPNSIVEAPKRGVPVRTRSLTGFTMYLRYTGASGAIPSGQGRIT